MQLTRTENESLRDKSGPLPTSSRRVSVNCRSPGAYSPGEKNRYDDYDVQFLINGDVVNIVDKEHTTSHHMAKGKEVPVAQAWDLIQSHPLVKQGLVEVADVCERLKGAAKCDGHGLVFEESIIWQVIEELRGRDGEELA